MAYSRLHVLQSRNTAWRWTLLQTTMGCQPYKIEDRAAQGGNATTYHKAALDEARQEAQRSVLDSVGQGAELQARDVSHEHRVRHPAWPRAGEEGNAQSHRLLVVSPQQLHARSAVSKMLEHHAANHMLEQSCSSCTVKKKASTALPCIQRILKCETRGMICI